MLKKISFLSLFFSLALGQQAQQDSCQLFATPQQNIVNIIINDINLIGAGGYIGIESPYITNQRILTALVQAVTRDAYVHLIISQEEFHRNPQHYTDLRNFGINLTVIENLHAKRIVMAQNTPIAGQPIQGHKVTYIGSMNFTQHAPHNLEIMARCRDEQIFTTNYNDQQFLLTSTDTYIQTHYNENRFYPYPHFNLTIQRTLSSLSRNSQQAKINIISTYPTCQNDGDHLYIAAMTLDDPQIVGAILEAKNNTQKPITVILDGSYEDNNTRHFYVGQLLQAGIQVYIYNRDRITASDGYSKLFHMKFILRICNNQCAAVIFTGNLTRENQQTINHDLWVQCSSNFSNRLRNIINNIIANNQTFEL